MGMEFVVDNIEDMCELLCNNRLPILAPKGGKNENRGKAHGMRDSGSEKRRSKGNIAD